jgi:hypothetical protein
MWTRIYNAPTSHADTDPTIAADLPRGFEHRADVQVRALHPRGDVGGEDAVLDLARDAQLSGDLLADRIGIGLGLEERPHAGLDLQHLEGLGEVVVSADLEALRLVADLVQRTQEHDRDFARCGGGAQPATDLVAVEAGHDHVERTRSGGFFSTMRRAVPPFRATLDL